MNKVLKFGRTVLLEVVYLALWLAAVPPSINYLLFFNLIAGWILILLLLHLARWGYLIKNRREPHVPGFLLWIPACVLMPLWGLMICGELRLVHPSYPWVALASGFAVAVLCADRKLPMWMKAVSCMPAFVMWIIYFPAKVIIIAVLALGVILFIVKKMPGKRTYRLPAWAPASAAMTFFTIFVALRFYIVNGDADPRLIEAQPGVHALFTYDEEDPVGRLLNEQIMYVKKGCSEDVVYIGLQGRGNTGLIKYYPASGKAEKSALVGESSDNMILNCKRGEIVIGDFSCDSAVRFIRTSDISTPTRPPIPVEYKATRIEAALDGSRYYALNEAHKFFVYPGTGGKAIARFTGPDEWIYYPGDDYFIAFTEPDFSIMRFRYKDTGEAGMIEVEARQDLNIPIYQRLNLFLQKGAVPGSVLVSNMWDGALTEIDKDFNLIRRKFISPGVRNIAVTPDGKTIIVAGYADGILYFLNAHSWRITAKRYIGRRIRGLNLSADGQFLYAGSSQGGFRLDVHAIVNTEGNVEFQN